MLHGKRISEVNRAYVTSEASMQFIYKEVFLDFMSFIQLPSVDAYVKGHDGCNHIDSEKNVASLRTDLTKVKMKR